MITKLGIDSIILNHLKYVLNYRQVRSDKKIEIFKEINYEKLLKILNDYKIVRTNVAKGINEILNQVKSKIEGYIPDLKYDLEKTPWRDSILFSFSLTPKVLLEYDHSLLLKYFTLIDRAILKIPEKIRDLFYELNKITENKKELMEVLDQHKFIKVYDPYDTIYSKKFKIILNGNVELLENFLDRYENLLINFDKTKRYFTVDIKITGKELISELKEFLKVLDHYFETYKEH